MISKIGNGDGTATVRGGKRKIYGSIFVHSILMKNIHEPWKNYNTSLEQKEVLGIGAD